MTTRTLISYTLGEKVAFEGQEPENVTLIFAMKESDSAWLFGADTNSRDETGIKEVKHKLRKLTAAPVAWACSGNADLGDEFSGWLQTAEWPPQSWGEFEESFRTKLDDINGLQRAHCKRAGVDWENDYGVTCLLVAWLQGIAHVKIYGADSLTEDCSVRGFGAIGTGRPVIFVAYRAIEPIKDIPPEERFRHLLTLAARMAQDCSEPVDAWRITVDGVEKLRGYDESKEGR